MSARIAAASRGHRPSVRGHHHEWLRLVDTSGPFLSANALLSVFPQGLDELSGELRQRLRLAHEEWLDEATKESPDPSIHTAWIRYVFREALGFEARDILEGQALPPSVRVDLPQHKSSGQMEVLAPSFALRGPDGALRLLVVLEAADQDLEHAKAERAWKASPAARMMTLLHGAQAHGGPRLGLVTNGHAWVLVAASAGEPTTYATFTTELFFDEPLTLRAFVSLLGLKRFFNVPQEETLEALLEASAKDQQEVTEQLGAQVRRAVEVLIQTIDRVDRARRGELLRGIAPAVLYEASITVMMRLVFLLAAEERGLLLRGSDLYDQHYAAGTLRDQLQELADRHGEELLERRHDAWPRLSATFRAIFAGIEHEDLRLPAYGGSLFDPDRFPFLEGRAPGTHYADPAQAGAAPLAIDNRTVLHLLRAIQELELRDGAGPTERRRLSFRSLDVEQIGHVYEGLLDHTAKRASDVTISLAGKYEPEIAVAELEQRHKQDEYALVEWLAEQTGKQAGAITHALAYEPQQEDKRRLLLACENKAALYNKVEKWAGLIRKDTHDLPVVLGAGAVYVTDGDERRSTGTHYTPRSLTEPIVEHTLEPLVYVGPAEGEPRDNWRLKSPRDILALKVCDIAMGSGAFLVQVCRYLSARVVEAWALAEEREGHDLLVAPDGVLSVGAVGERLIPALPPPEKGQTRLAGVDLQAGADEPAPPSVRGRPSRPPGKVAREEERLALARRYVADRCLFGVDKNPWAVEMAKLSLWLVTLQKDRPFTFLDHALVAGDSLLGITKKEQLLNFHLDPVRGKEIHRLFAPKKWIDGELKRAAEAREKIESLATMTIVDAHHKAFLERQAREATSDLAVLGDLLMGAALASSCKQPALDRTLKNLAEDAIRLLPTDEEARSRASTQSPGRAKLRERLRKTARDLLDQGRGPGHASRTPLHWALTFPEVSAQGGFDAFVGNPPFQGGQRLTGALGTDYRDYMVQHVAEGRRGSADLCAYFFLRAAHLLREPGMAGLLATNTIAQGDTREVGLDALVAKGMSPIRALPSMKWPGEANLEVAEIWFRRGAWNGRFVLGDVEVPGITSQLTRPGRAIGTPHRLAANEDRSFIGSYVLGMGFTMPPEEALALIERDNRNRDVLFPYLNGQDLNTDPQQRAVRWVITFFDWPLDRKSAPQGYVGPVAEDYRDCLAIVRQKVKPERDRLANGDATARDRARRWWQFARPTRKLYAAIRGLPRVLVRALSGKHNAFVFIENNLVIDQTAPAFIVPSAAGFAVLVSNIHGEWALEYGATLKKDPRYTPSDCFETFPFPLELATLESIGERYHAHRAALMKDNQEGLTSTYNRFHKLEDRDAGIQRLRDLHVEMDQAVVAAYGWQDLALEHGFHETKHGIRFTVSETARTELLDRLLELNHQRYAEEVKQGLHAKAGAASTTGARAKPTKAAIVGAPSVSGRAPTRRHKQAPPQLGLEFGSTAATSPANDDAPLYIAASAAAAAPPHSTPTVALSADASKLLKAVEAASEPLGKGALLGASRIDAKRWSAAIHELEQNEMVEQQGEGRGARYARKF